MQPESHKNMWHEYINASSTEEVLDILAGRGARARIIAGATDLILEMESGVRTDIDTLIDVTRIPGLNEISLDGEGHIHLGAMVTHSQCVDSELIVERALPLAQAAIEVGAPQIRNRGTVAGNLITASPANDTITPLMALGASVTMRSAKGERKVPLKEFYAGFRKTVMQPEEMLVDISFPAMETKSQRGIFIKLALRRAQAISIVNVAVVLTITVGKVEKAAITLGSVAETIIHAEKAEDYLLDRALDEKTITQTTELVAESASPIDDVRSSAEYRTAMLRVCARRALNALARNDAGADYPKEPVLLLGDRSTPSLSKSVKHTKGKPISTTINGQAYKFESGQHKSLLRLLREEALLVGTKEGCAEGECGACTVFLDGAAVMSCMVSAPRAHKAEIITIEGLAKNGDLHPVQQAFIDQGAVQCGYCTPGLIMSAAKLLEEDPSPSVSKIQQAITGNLCRCTGYYKIIRAIQRAGQSEV